MRRKAIMPGSCRLLGVSAAAVTLIACFAATLPAEPPVLPKRVLLAYFQDATLPAFLEFDRSVIEALRAASAPGLEVYREQLDSVRRPEYTARRVAELRSRYLERKIDVIIYLGDVPINILPGVPVIEVDLGLHEEALDETYGRNNWVHVDYYIDPRKTVDAAKRLQPRAKKLLLVSGAGVDDRVALKRFRERLTGESDLDVRVINTLSVPRLEALLSRLPPDVIVFPVSYLQDPDGNNYLMRDVMKRLADASSAPVYSVSETFLGDGTVGGYVINWQKLGEVAAEAATRILRGAAPAQVAQSSGACSYMFDWRQLKKWAFSEHDLPPGSILRYKTPTAWEQYRWRIVAIGLLIIAQFFLIASLLLQRYRRRHAEDSARDMAGRLLQSQDDERRRIARDLHDGSGQHLSGIALSLGQVLSDFPPGYPRLRQLLQDSHVASRQALNEIRAVSYALHPPILDGLRLAPALEWYLDGLQKRTSFNIAFEAPESMVDSTPEAERTLFRIVQEGVTNVLRHSGGTALKVRLSNGAKGIVLEIEDNGRGMSAEELEQAGGSTSLGVGVAGMRERVRQLHGVFRITSSSQGTRVLVSLPACREGYAAHPSGG